MFVWIKKTPVIPYTLPILLSTKLFIHYIRGVHYETLFTVIHLSGWPVSEESHHEAAELSGVLQEGNDFLPTEVTEECERIIPEVDNVKPRDAVPTSS